VATRESLLLANQVELILQPPLSDLPALQTNANLKVVLTPTARSTFVAMDLTLPGGTPLAIKKIRQALNYAVDRDGIIRNVLFGAATPLDAPMASTLVGYSRVGGYSFDPNRARQLLLEGGTPHLSLRFTHPTGRSMQGDGDPGAQALGGNLARSASYGAGRFGLAVLPGIDQRPRGQGHRPHAPVQLGTRIAGRVAADDPVRSLAVAAAGAGNEPLLESESRVAGQRGRARTRRFETQGPVRRGATDRVGRRTLDLPVGAEFGHRPFRAADRHCLAAHREILSGLRRARVALRACPVYADLR
jgi:hypothetical protein